MFGQLFLGSIFFHWTPNTFVFSPKSKSRVPIICCSYYAWTKCTVNALKEMGSNTCPQSTVDAYDQHIKKSSVEAMNLICRRYEDNDEKCTQFFSELERKKPKTLRKTPLLYVFDVFDSI